MSSAPVDTPTILLIDVSSDVTTREGSGLRDLYVASNIIRSHFPIVRLRGKDAHRRSFRATIKKTQVGFISGFGHGEGAAFFGQDDQPIFGLGVTEAAEVEGRILHLLACGTAEELGPGLVIHGCRAFFGYDGDFVYHPRFAAVFFLCATQVDRTLARGASAAEAYRRTVALFDRTIEDLDLAGKPYLASVLESDRDRFCAPTVDRRFGNPAACLNPTYG